MGEDFLISIKNNISYQLEKVTNIEEISMEYPPLSWALGTKGKNLRGCLCILAQGLCNPTLKPEFSIAVALELLHVFSLVHDDIMDQSLLRRGKATVYKKYGASAAILSGDIIFALAQKYIQKGIYSKPSDVVFPLLKRYNEIFIELSKGQILDISLDKSKKYDMKYYLKMITYKTVALILGSIQLGVLYRKGTTKQYNILSSIGNYIGKAFQIQDDLLDYIGAKDWQKERGEDLKGGKTTYPLLCLFHKPLLDKERKFCQQSLQQKDNPNHSLNSIIDLMKKYGIIEQIRNEILALYQKSLTMLNYFDSSSYKEALIYLLSKTQYRV